VGDEQLLTGSADTVVNNQLGAYTTTDFNNHAGYRTVEQSAAGIV
jgi:hypothetical protein